MDPISWTELKLSQVRVLSLLHALSERRVRLDDAKTIAAFARDMSQYLRESDFTETKSFISSFVKEIAVGPGKATIRYAIPMPQDSPIGGGDAREVALRGRVLSTVGHGTPGETRTHDTRFRKPLLYPPELQGRFRWNPAIIGDHQAHWTPFTGVDARSVAVGGPAPR